MMTLRRDFKRQKELLNTIWIEVYKKKSIFGEALKVRIPFATTFLCVAEF